MIEFTYNNAKNTSTSHIIFELNYRYYPCVLFEKNVNTQFKSMLADKLLLELQKLMIIYCKNLLRIQKLQKQVHNKDIKSRSYISSNKVWFNSKYIKIKQNRKLKVKFFGPFQVLHPMGKQMYKLKLFKKNRVYNVFYVSLLEQDTIRKR